MYLVVVAFLIGLRVSAATKLRFVDVAVDSRMLSLAVSIVSSSRKKHRQSGVIADLRIERPLSREVALWLDHARTACFSLDSSLTHSTRIATVDNSESANRHLRKPIDRVLRSTDPGRRRDASSPPVSLTDWSWHSIRHGFVTACRALGVAEDMMQYLGDWSSATFKSYYGIRRAAVVADNVFFGDLLPQRFHVTSGVTSASV